MEKAAQEHALQLDTRGLPLTVFNPTEPALDAELPQKLQLHIQDFRQHLSS